MPKKHGTVLVADDESNVRSLITRMLGEEYSVIEAENGEIAVNMARRYKPDFVLMDIMMPKMDGYTACKTIKTNPETKAIPVVMLTALNFELNIGLSHDMGADAYMTKPFNQQDLLAMVRRFVKIS